MPHRAPGSTGKTRQQYLSGKPIRYYRPRGSADIHHLIDEGFQAFNAARLGEACRIFTDKMLLPEHDTTIALTIAGALTPAGLGGCIVEMMERGLVDFVISTGANLYHDLHYALNFTLHRGSPFVNDVELYEEGVIRIYDVLFPSTRAARNRRVHPRIPRPVGNERAGVDRRVSLCARPRPDGASAWMRGVLGRRRGCGRRRADLHLVARRQLDRDEHRLPRADERQRPDDRSEQGRQRGVRVHPRRKEERLRDSRRRIAEELLPAGAADALGGLRHPEGRQRLFHPDHDRSGCVGWPLGRHAGRSRELGQGQSRCPARTPSSLTATRRSPSRSSASTSWARRTAAARGRSWSTNATRSLRSCETKRRRRPAPTRSRTRKSRRCPIWRGIGSYGIMGTLASELGPHAERITEQPRVYVDANVPAGLVAFMREIAALGRALRHRARRPSPRP